MKKLWKRFAEYMTLAGMALKASTPDSLKHRLNPPPGPNS